MKTFIHSFTYTHVHTQRHACMCIRTHAHTKACMHVYTQRHACMCTHTQDQRESSHLSLSSLDFIHQSSVSVRQVLSYMKCHGDQTGDSIFRGEHKLRLFSMNESSSSVHIMLWTLRGTRKGVLPANLLYISMCASHWRVQLDQCHYSHLVPLPCVLVARAMTALIY